MNTAPELAICSQWCVAHSDFGIYETGTTVHAIHPVYHSDAWKCMNGESQ